MDENTNNNLTLTIQLEKLAQIGINREQGILTIDGAMVMFPVDKPQQALKAIAEHLGLPTKRKRRTKAEIEAEAAAAATEADAA